MRDMKWVSRGFGLEEETRPVLVGNVLGLKR